MIRRAPIRIELKLEDLQEFEAARREMEVRRQEQGASSSSSVDATTPLGSSPPGGLWTPGAPNAKRTYRTARLVGFVPQPHFTWEWPISTVWKLVTMLTFHFIKNITIELLFEKSVWPVSEELCILCNWFVFFISNIPKCHSEMKISILLILYCLASF